MTAKQVRQACEHLIKGGMTAIHFIVLNDLSQKYLTMTEIAKATGTSTANTTTLVDRMEKQGLLERTHRADDRRSIFVQLTPAGRAKLDAITQSE